MTGSERKNNKINKKKKNNFEQNVGCSLFYMTYELFLCKHVNCGFCIIFHNFLNLASQYNMTMIMMMQHTCVTLFQASIMQSTRMKICRGRIQNVGSGLLTSARDLFGIKDCFRWNECFNDLKVSFPIYIKLYSIGRLPVARIWFKNS